MKRTAILSRKPIGQRGSILKSPVLRERKCAVCGERFKPQRMGMKVCSPACALGFLQVERGRLEEARARIERAEDRLRKESLKTRQDHLKSAQGVFNKYIRERDAHLPCISCGRFHTGAWDAGHYRSVGAQPALRFHEDNVHRQCVPCNQHKSGNAIEYRLGLIARIGAERVAFLEQEHPPLKLTIEDAKRIKAEYRQKIKELKETS